MIELPKGWEWKKVKDVCEKPQYGYTTKASKEGTLKFLRTTDISKGPIQWSKVPYCQDDPTDASKYHLQSGDVLISRAGSIGLSVLIDDPPEAVFASYLIRFRPNICPKYFYYFLQSPFFWQQVNAGKVGIAVPNLNATKIGDFDIPVAPTSKHEEVVKKVENLINSVGMGETDLETVDSSLELFKQSILNAAIRGQLVPQDPNDEPASVLLKKIKAEKEVLIKAKKIKKEKLLPPIDPDEVPFELPEGWVWCRIAELAKNEKYSMAIGPFGSNLKVSDYTRSGVPLIFVRNIRSKNYSDKAKYVSTKKAEELSAHTASPGDVLVTKMGDPPGDASVYPKGMPKAVITADCIKITLDERVADAHYISSVINSPIIKPQILSQTKGVAQKKVSLARFKELLVPTPPIDEQRRIVSQVRSSMAATQNGKDEVEQLEALSSTLKQSILKSAFEGKLV